MNTNIFNTEQVIERYSISRSTLHRWLEDEKLAFPRPGYIRKRPYWRVVDLDSFDDLKFGAP